MSEANNTTSREDRSAFTQLAERAAHRLREERSRRVIWESLDGRVPWLLWVVPLGQIALVSGAHLFGVAGGKFSAGTLIFWTLAVPLVYLVWRAIEARSEAISSQTALAEWDRRLGLSDRLSTAAEFLDVSERTPFMQAAIDDATQRLSEVESKGWVTREEERELRPRSVGAGVFGVIALILALWIAGVPASPSLDPSTESGSDAWGEVARASRDTLERDSAEEPATPPAPTPPREDPSAAAMSNRTGTPPSETMGDDIKKTRGRTQAGSPSPASFSTGASEARGTPTEQGQTSKSPEKKVPPPKKKKPKERAEPKETAPPKREEEKPSGATAGRGAASGSNKSPSTSSWSSRDKVVSDEDDDLEDDEEVDDEFDIEDARAGLQPQLRDRKPPVNRDLSIGFGHGKDPDANGRGGPSQQKKSRGVASLVLGVPIPDHVKGRPNPGKTKVTQERVKPRAEESKPVDAQARTRGDVAVASHDASELDPWMRDFLRDYFLSVRNQQNTMKKTSTSEKNATNSPEGRTTDE